MSFFSLFRDTAESVVLIDIGSASVAGTYARFENGKKPALYYTARVPIRARQGESALANMERALASLAKTLVHEGAPAFARATGSGSVDRVIVSVASLWQETRVHTERMSKETPFRFTQHLMDDLVEKSAAPAQGRTPTTEMVIATRLNGYDVTNPFGKMVSEAEVVALSSSLAQDAAETISRVLRRTFHTSDIALTAFAPVMFLALRDLFTLEKDFFVMDVSGETTDLLLVKDAVLREAMSVPHGLNELRRAAIEAGLDSAAPDGPIRAVKETVLLDSAHNSRFAAHMQAAREAWVKGLADAFRTLMANYALPHTLFLLADESAHEFLTHILQDPDFRSLWLSDEPMQVRYIDPGQLAPFVAHHGRSKGDTFLSMLALYAVKEKDLADSVVHGSAH